MDPVWEEFPVRPPGDGEALVEVEACGIGSTVLNLLRGDGSGGTVGLPRVPGHELVGRVIETGAAADRGLVGRRVTAYFYLFCGQCDACVAGFEDRCQRLAGLIGVEVDGGYAPFATLPTRNLVTIPDGLDAIAATVIPDAVATPVHICRTRAQVNPFDRVAIIGAGGGVGIHLVQVARLFGAAVAGLDVSEEKLAAIRELGAIAVRSDDFARVERRIWPTGGPTVVVDFIGSPDSLAWAQGAIEPGGRIIAMTSFPNVRGDVEQRHLVENELAILGSRYATLHEVQFAADLVATGRVRPIIGLTAPASRAIEIHERLRSRRLVGRGAIRWP
jgi:alcohol dehydrogenase, propanol-preferring